MTTQDMKSPATEISQADSRSDNVGPKVTTALICDTPLLRSGLQRVLSGTPFALADEGPTTDPGLVSEKAREPALIILVVSQLSSRTPEMVQQIKQHHSTARIVILADDVDVGLVMQGREAGVDGFCLTGSSREVLITSLELVMLGESVLTGPVVRSILDRMALSPEPEPASEVPYEPKLPAPGGRSLSAREAEVLSSLMAGEPNKIIARKLDLTEATVKVHIKAILRKIGATNRTQAAMWAMGHQHD